MSFTMPLLVVAYPQLEATDYAWIQTLRQQHDPHYALIAPHFTLVFPVNTLSHEQIVAHTTAVATQTSTIRFVIRCATIVKDAFSQLTQVFLVPEEGYSAIVKLHDALYTQLLTDALRLDIPFIPHITVGGHPDPRVCKALADDINRQHICIKGRIDALDCIAYENNTVTPVRRVALV
jgi:2'-5' RNA ligase